MLDSQSPLAPNEWLKAEYERRKVRNRRYSLRAFARLLEVSPGRLSEILARKRFLTPKLGQRISRKLALAPMLDREFLASIERELQTREAFRGDLRELAKAVSNYQELRDDTFSLIKDWQHFAILALMQTRGFTDDPGWIAKRIGVSSSVVEDSLRRLLRLGLIEFQGEQLTLSRKDLATNTDRASEALREHHRQVLTRTCSNFPKIALEKRDVTSSTLAVDPSRLPRAKEMIRNFRRRLCKYLEAGTPTEVYHLNVQLLPVALEAEVVETGSTEKEAR